MNELQAQKLIIDAVRGEKGFAYKLSSRFMVGVPDLMVQYPSFTQGIRQLDYPTTIVEVKIGDMPKRVTWVTLDITPKQGAFLRDFGNAGGCAIVVSFLRKDKQLHMYAVPYRVIKYADDTLSKYETHTGAYTALVRGTREKTINDLMKQAVRNCLQPV